ncbi:MAG: hypothetical protein H0V51_19405 [Chloroflexi bacterium]|nr:hypothetical protein [Chloroflexota bacterium]
MRRVNAVELAFHTRLQLTADVEAGLDAALHKRWRDEGTLSMVQRSGGKRRRQVMVLALVRTKDSMVLDGHLAVSGENEPQATSETPTQFLRKLGAAFKQRATIHLMCRFLYAPNEHELLFPLPIPLKPGQAAFDFDEIRGVRLVKKDGEAIAHEVILDRPENEDVSVTFVTHVDDLLDTKLPDRLLSHAVEIAGNVVKVQTRASIKGT